MKYYVIYFEVSFVLGQGEKKTLKTLISYGFLSFVLTV